MKFREQVKEIFSLFKLSPFEISSEHGRRQERHRRILLTSFGSLVAKGTAILVTLITVPITVGYLGAEKYGLLMTISSVAAMLGFADLGMGNGLLNAIGEAHGRDDRESARRYVSSGFFMLLGMALLISIVFAACYGLISWRTILHVGPAGPVQEVGPALAVFVACVALGLPFGVVERVQMGYQEGYVNSLWAGIGSIFMFVGIYVAVFAKAGLPGFVLAIAGAPVLASILYSISVFCFQRPYLRPRLDGVSRDTVNGLFRIGMLFLVLQVALLVATASDNIIIAHLLGPSEVSRYAIPLRLFGIPTMAMGFILTPLWPAYREAAARGDMAWARSTLMRSLRLCTLVCGVPALLLVIFGKMIITLWVGREFQPSWSLLLGMGTWSFLFGIASALAIFLNGINVIRFQALCGILMAGISLILKYFFAGYWGIAGVIWGASAAQLVFIVLPLSWYVRRYIFP